MNRLKARTAFAIVLAALALVAARAGASPAVVVGPVLGRLRPDEITVVVGLDGAAPVEVEARAASGAPVRAEDPSHRWHELALRGLAPSTAYDYVVRVGGTEVAHGAFTTAPPDGAEVPVRFLVYGDTRDDAAAHAVVARAMARERAAFVLHTGDLVGDGASASDWQTFFDATRETFSSLPFFSTIGNHEVTSPEGIARYRASLALPGNELHYRIDHGPLRFLVLDSNEDLERGSEQRTWLDGELAAARAAPPPHLFVLIHHGPLSSGYHGENPRIRGTDVERALRRGGVELIFEGHDHAYERGDADGLKYVLSGGGGAPLYPRNSEHDYQLAFLPAHHYVRVDVAGDDVRVAALAPDGEVLDACGYRGRAPWRCVGGRGHGRGRVWVAASTLGAGRGAAVIAAVLGAGFAAWWQRRRRR